MWLPDATGDELTVGLGTLGPGVPVVAFAGVNAGILSPPVFGPTMLTNASGAPERLPPVGSGFAVGKLEAPEDVSPARYTFNEASSAMLVPISVPLPPRKLTVLGLVLDDVPVVLSRATNASLAPP